MPIERRLINEAVMARVLLTLAILSGVVAAVATMLLAYFLSLTVHRVFLEDQHLSGVLSLLFTMLILVFIRFIAVWLQEILGQRCATEIKSNLRQRLLEKISDLGPLYTRAERSGELTNTLVEGVESLNLFVTQYLTTKVLAILVPALTFVVILVLDPWTTLIFVVAAPMMLLILALIGGRARAMTEQRFIEMSWMSAFFLDILQGLTTLKLFSRDQEQIANIKKISDDYGSSTMEILRTAFQSSLVMEWAATAATAMVALTVSLRLMNSTLPFSTALTVLILTPEFFLPIRQYALRFHAGTAGKAAAHRIFDIIDAPMVARPVSRNKSLAPPPGQLDITFQEVNFTYVGEERPALQEISLTIPQGNRLLIAGATGSGKTTISQLLLRFAYPDSGQILVGDQQLQDIELDAWRHQVAWVPQLPHLFHGTVGDNIRLGRPQANQQEITAAATAAQAHDFINQLPQGYETLVGEGGARLSGGQRQRIAIARALLKDAPILLLDEPTAHLDQALEQALLTTLNGLANGRTIIIIAHYLEPAFDFDQIVVMEQGRLVESGRGSNLLAGDGRYRRLLGLARQQNGGGGAK